MGFIGGLFLAIGAFLQGLGVQTLGFLIFAAGLFLGLVAGLHFWLRDRPDSRAALAEWVAGYRLGEVDGARWRTPRRIARYETALADVLDWLDVRLSKPEREHAGPETRTVAFSRGLLDTCLLLALLYPLGALLAQWAAGYEGRLGPLTILPAGAPLTRAATIGALGFSGFLYFRAERTRSRWRVPLFILATGILLGWLFLLGGELGAFAVAGAVAVTFAVAGAGAGAGAFAVAFAFAVAGAVAVAFAGAVAGAGAFAVAGAVAVTFAVAGAGAGAVAWLDRRRGPRPAHMLGLVLVLLAGVAIAIPLLPEAGSEDDALALRTILLFMALLPLANAVADFASIGTTRLLLRRGLHGRRVGFLLAFADLLMAALIFALLGCVLIAFIHLVRFQNGAALLDLAALFADLRVNSGDYGWLAVMLLSTLLPTLIHLTIAVSSVFLGLRSGALAEMIACERKAFLGRAEWGAFFLIGTLAISALLAAAAVFVLVWGVAAWLDPGAGPGPVGTVIGAILDGFEAVFLWLQGVAPR